MDYVLAKLEWMRSERIWPNGLRYLWTDAFGVMLYLSLYQQTGEERWLDAAEELVGEVDRVLGRPRGYRIGEASDRDGQYFHYLAMWLFALARLGDVKPEYRAKGIAVAKAIHPAFVLPGRGVIWKMEEDLRAPYPGYGLGAMDAFDGYVSYRCLDPRALTDEIDEMRTLIERQYRTLDIDQDLGLGMMLWLCHFFPTEDWARVQTERSLAALDRLWIDPPGYYGRASYAPHVRIAFANYGVSLGLQAVNQWPERVDRLNTYFDVYRSNDEYDREAITHVMACASHLPGLFLNADNRDRGG
ncbi:glycoside hydrolase family 76 protein [Rhizobium leguminosarum]|nr:glycoside hydrolase family 76 protein [Rhizobium leguminosarum]